MSPGKLPPHNCRFLRLSFSNRHSVNMSISCLCAATPNPTPFLFTVQDALTLDTSEGFQILREHLAATIKHDFCNNHRTSDAEDSQAWLVVRDVLHALLAPIVALEEHATRVAEAYVRSPRSEDLEFAYYGRGRNAFVWLQSFLSSDMDWCLSNGCPGKIMTLPTRRRNVI